MARSELRVSIGSVLFKCSKNT